MAFPEPPWTQAPSEVMAWGSSIRGRTRSTAPVRRPMRVKGYAIRLPVAEESRVVNRLSRLGLVPWREGSAHRSRMLPHVLHHATAVVFVGQARGTRIEVRLRKRSRLEVHVTFVPQIALRKAWRVVSRLGLRPDEGTWQ